MAQTTMYTINTPGLKTVLTQALSQNDTSLYVEDLTVFDTAPNLVTIVTSSNSWEVCKYTAKTVVSGNQGYLTIVRSGAEHISSSPANAAVAFLTGAKAFRALTNYDIAALIANISDHESRILANSSAITTLQAAAPTMDPVTAALIFG